MDYMLSSTCTSNFLDKLKALCFKSNDILISFDIVRLFTYVPLSETINIMADKIYTTDSKPNFDKARYIQETHVHCNKWYIYVYEFMRYPGSDLLLLIPTPPFICLDTDPGNFQFSLSWIRFGSQGGESY